jgi:hypothetical protein
MPTSLFCFIGEISLKKEIITKKFRSEMILGFNGQKWGKIKASIARFLYIGFWLCSHKYRKLILNIVTSYLIHSQIWLNLVKDDCHFSYIFLITFAMKNNNNNNSLIKGQCKPRIMFQRIKGLIVENLTKCKLVHHITPRNNTKFAILIHKECFFYIFLWMIINYAT